MARVVRIYENGGPSVLRVENADIDAPGFGEVRLRQEAIGINFVDGMVRQGLYPQPVPTIPGFGANGVVTEVGPGVTDFGPGDRVAYFFVPGAYATERLVPSQSIVRLPEDISTEAAGAFLAKGLTAWVGLRVLHDIQPGQAALVLGASGGVGVILSRWSKALGATTIGVAGSSAKLAKVEAGSSCALLADDPEILTKIRALAPNGVDVVYDLVGKATFHLAVAAIRDGGTIATLGAASGQPSADQHELTRRKITVRGGGMPSFVKGAVVPVATEELWNALRQGTFADLEIIKYPFADVVKAHTHMSARQFDGLPVLIP